MLARLLLIICAFGCKPLKESQSLSVEQLIPKRVDKSENIATVKWGTVDFDQSGTLINSLVLSLDYIGGAPHSGSKPKCLSPMKGRIVLGRIKCFKGAKEEISLNISHVNQECYTDSTAKKVEAETELILPGCQKATVYGFKFEPVIRVDIE